MKIDNIISFVCKENFRLALLGKDIHLVAVQALLQKLGLLWQDSDVLFWLWLWVEFITLR